jgi:hypothetical protein
MHAAAAMQMVTSLIKIAAQLLKKKTSGRNLNGPSTSTDKATMVSSFGNTGTVLQNFFFLKFILVSVKQRCSSLA